MLVVLLLPMFFALTGLHARIGLVTGMHAWPLSGLVILVACVGKFGGNSVAARWTGYNWRNAWALGILMNTNVSGGAMNPGRHPDPKPSRSFSVGNPR